MPALFDVDDLIVDPDLQDEIPALRLLRPDEADLWMDGVRRYRTTLEACDGYVGSTSSCCATTSVALTGLPSYRFSNGVGLVTRAGRTRRCVGRGRRDRCGSATSRGRRPTTATGSRSSRRCSR